MGFYFNVCCGFIGSAFFMLRLYDKSVELEEKLTIVEFYRDKRKPEFTTEKLILLWTKTDDFEQSIPYLDRCAINKCRVIRNNQSMFDLRDADALIFDDAELKIIDLPINRFVHQRYIYFNLKPPDQSSDSKWAKNYFNWTATYRVDSEIYWPFGMVYERIEPFEMALFRQKLKSTDLGFSENGALDFGVFECRFRRLVGT